MQNLARSSIRNERTVHLKLLNHMLEKHCHMVVRSIKMSK